MASGHPDAPHYPVHKVWEEAVLVVNRANQIEATRAILNLMAVSAGTHGGSAIKEFNKFIEDFSDGAEG